MYRMTTRKAVDLTVSDDLEAGSFERYSTTEARKLLIDLDEQMGLLASFRARIEEKVAEREKSATQD